MKERLFFFLTVEDVPQRQKVRAEEMTNPLLMLPGSSNPGRNTNPPAPDAFSSDELPSQYHEAFA